MMTHHLFMDPFLNTAILAIKFPTHKLRGHMQTLALGGKAFAHMIVLWILTEEIIGHYLNWWGRGMRKRSVEGDLTQTEVIETRK